MLRSYLKSGPVAKVLGKDERKNARRCAHRHIEDIFTRRRTQVLLRPFAAGGTFKTEIMDDRPF